MKFCLMERTLGYRGKEGFMFVWVNGKEKEYEENITIQQLIEREGYKKEQIAVEVNEAIIPKAEYEGYVIAPNDKLEVVSFVGGG